MLHHLVNECVNEKPRCIVGILIWCFSNEGSWKKTKWYDIVRLCDTSLWLCGGVKPAVFSHTATTHSLFTCLSGFNHSPSQCFSLSPQFYKDSNPSDLLSLWSLGGVGTGHMERTWGKQFGVTFLVDIRSSTDMGMVIHTRWPHVQMQQ